MANTEAFSIGFKSQIPATVTVNGDFSNSQNNNYLIDGMNEQGTYNATSTPVVSKVAAFKQALTAGAATISLEALPGQSADETVNMVGLKAQFIKLINPSTNANKMVVSNGASNPYRLDGATTAWSVPLAPGQSVLLALDGAGDTVGSSHLNIDVAGTGSQVLWVEIAGG